MPHPKLRFMETLRSLDLADEASRAEHVAYEQLARAHRRIAVALTRLSERMVGCRDLPMGRHDAAALLGGDASFYRTAFEAFAGHSAQFILSAGHHLDLRSLDPVPENFIVRPAVPQLELLPKVDLFVTHGGANSLNEALYHGVPVVVIPPHLEQAVNGLHQRVTRATMPACTRSIRRRGRVIFEREDVEQREAAG